MLTEPSAKGGTRPLECYECVHRAEMRETACVALYEEKAPTEKRRLSLGGVLHLTQYQQVGGGGKRVRSSRSSSTT